jgi:hypothetical protein
MGNTVGILRTRNEGRFSQLDEPENEELIHRCMTQIISLLTDGESFKMNTEADQLYKRMAGTVSMSA